MLCLVLLGLFMLSLFLIKVLNFIYGAYIQCTYLPFSVQVWMRRSLIQTCTLKVHMYKVTYTRCRIDTINSLMMGTGVPETCRE